MSVPELLQNLKQELEPEPYARRILTEAYIDNGMQFQNVFTRLKSL